MVELFQDIETRIGEITVVVFNIGANVRFSITETTERVYRKVCGRKWRRWPDFLTGREAARPCCSANAVPSFSPAQQRRCGNGFAAFASAKFALRGLAQSMARELGPQASISSRTPSLMVPLTRISSAKTFLPCMPGKSRKAS
ncbi:MAG: hypothetical protein R3F38_08785 [Gammaproteobacteria bacterium]